MEIFEDLLQSGLHLSCNHREAIQEIAEGLDIFLIRVGGKGTTFIRGSPGAGTFRGRLNTGIELR